MTQRYVIVLAFAIGSVAIAAVQTSKPPSASGDNSSKPTLHLPDKTTWTDGPASVPRGAKMAVLEGDPAKEGPFVFRLKYPDGFRIPPHTHSDVERLTVIQGTFNIGMGDKFDQSAPHIMPAGTFGILPAGVNHFAWTKGETVLQFHGTGPWTINYINPADDPRNAAGK